MDHTVFEEAFPVSGKMTVFYRDHKPTSEEHKVPILFLPGLMRNSSDFDRIAYRFADERRVVTIDTRGRGRGGRSNDRADYEFDAMIDDVWRVLDHLGIERVVIVAVALGTFMSWRMAVTHPERVAGIVANDTGTELVNKLGKKMVSLADQGEYEFLDAVEKIRGANQKNFPDFGRNDWQEYTRQIYAETAPGKWKRNFHPAILEAWTKTKEELPSMWQEFCRIGDIPVAILRGEGSEFLTLEHAEKMAAALPNAKAISIQGRGHPLRLDEPGSIIAIRDVLAQADDRQ